MAFILREAEGLGTDEICKILEVTRTNLGVLNGPCGKRPSNSG